MRRELLLSSFSTSENRCALSVVITGRTQFVCVFIEILAGSGKRTAAAATAVGNVGGTAPVGQKTAARALLFACIPRAPPGAFVLARRGGLIYSLIGLTRIIDSPTRARRSTAWPGGCSIVGGG